MKSHTDCEHIVEMIDIRAKAIRAAPPGGLFLEFGVGSGKSMMTWMGAGVTPVVYGFDSFEGLPEDWEGYHHGKGAFAHQPPALGSGAELVIGWFEDTLPKFLEEHPGFVSFVHVDCDLYSSTRTVLQHVGPRLIVGSVILFDEYHGYPSWERHEHRALMESDLRFEYVAHSSERVMIVIC